MTTAEHKIYKSAADLVVSSEIMMLLKFNDIFQITSNYYKNETHFASVAFHRRQFKYNIALWRRIIPFITPKAVFYLMHSSLAAGTRHQRAGK